MNVILLSQTHANQTTTERRQKDCINTAALTSAGHKSRAGEKVKRELGEDRGKEKEIKEQIVLKGTPKKNKRMNAFIWYDREDLMSLFFGFSLILGYIQIRVCLSI